MLMSLIDSACEFNLLELLTQSHLDLTCEGSSCRMDEEDTETQLTQETNLMYAE